MHREPQSLGLRNPAPLGRLISHEFPIVTVFHSSQWKCCCNILSIHSISKLSSGCAKKIDGFRRFSLSRCFLSFSWLASHSGHIQMKPKARYQRQATVVFLRIRLLAISARSSIACETGMEKVTDGRCWR